MTVEWRAIAGYEGIYAVSNDGRVKSLARVTPTPNGGRWRMPERILVASRGTSEYPQVTLRRGGKQKTFRVYRLVAAAFLADSHFPGAIVCHKDVDRQNSAVENLYWGTSQENNRDTVRHGNHINARKTHCGNGHEYTPANTRVVIRDDGRRRVCLACRRKWARDKYVPRREREAAAGC